MAAPKIFAMPFANVYRLLIEKLARKQRTKAELDEVIFWLTGYDVNGLQKQVDGGTSVEKFFDEAPLFNPNSKLITGMICGHRVEEIEDELMQKIRYLDKLVDELYKGKPMEKVLRK